MYHRIKIDKKLSSKNPLLFISYVNGFDRLVSSSFINLFVDDTRISIADNNFERFTETMNMELNISGFLPKN